jgi:hypothetical protein
MDEEIVKYFANKGFEVDWDHSKSGEKWYEFFFDGELLCQIDFGVSLEDLLIDLKRHKNKSLSEFGKDYVISAPEDKFKKFLEISLK